MERTFAILFLSVGACSAGQESSSAGADQAGATPVVKSHSSGMDSYYCGGETNLATVERYFSDLEKVLAQPGPARRFNHFVGTRLTVIRSAGRPLYFNVAELGTVTPRHITLQDWREIHRRGERGLHNAGYRGCFMDHGRVWFVASEEQGFRLAGIARNLPWVPHADVTSND